MCGLETGGDGGYAAGLGVKSGEASTTSGCILRVAASRDTAEKAIPESAPAFKLVPILNNIILLSPGRFVIRVLRAVHQ